jgi:acyl-CoA dehydrogenase
VVIGPRNYLFNAYQSMPISITVEGANIMTRNLLIFGQGSMACHPYLRQEFYAVAHHHESAFNQLLWKHVRYTLKNFSRMICSGLSLGYFISTSKHQLRREVQKLTALSHVFACLSDLSLILLGGALKRKERLSARLADALTHLYAAMATIHYFETQGKTQDDYLHVQWATQYAFHQAQQAMIHFCEQFPQKLIGYTLKFLAFPFGLTMKKPSDQLEHKLANLMVQNNAYRERLKELFYFNHQEPEAVDALEQVFQSLIEHEALYQKLADLKRFKGQELLKKLHEKVALHQLSQAEMDQFLSIEQARWNIEQVDEFRFEDFKQGKFESVVDQYSNPFMNISSEKKTKKTSRADS